MPKILRHVEIDGTPGGTYRLETWKAGEEEGRTLLGYRFSGPHGVLFEAQDIRLSPFAAPASDEALRTVLGFIGLQSGDVDPEYFADYTPAQLAFRDSVDAEWLGAYEAEGDPGWRDLPTEGEGDA